MEEKRVAGKEKEGEKRKSREKDGDERMRERGPILEEAKTIPTTLQVVPLPHFLHSFSLPISLLFSFFLFSFIPSFSPTYLFHALQRDPS